EVVRSDFKDFTDEQHRKLLMVDFLKPDHEYRRIGAYRRLAFYFPEEVEPLVLKQLTMPTYDIIAVERFVRRTLYAEESRTTRKGLFQDFLRMHGRAS